MEMHSNAQRVSQDPPKPLTSRGDRHMVKGEKGALGKPAINIRDGREASVKCDR